MKKAKWLSLATMAALVVGMLALASLAWAQEADQGDVGVEVVGGTAVPNGKYPFMVSLQEDTSARPPSKEHFCGGTLIDPDTVLTAGHCVTFIGNTTNQNTLSFRDVRIVVGVTALDSGQGQERSVEQLSDISVHPRFHERRNSANDVAVINLDRPVGGINPVELAAVGSDSPEKPGRRATVAGWGSLLAVPPRENRPEVKFPKRMREARVPIVSDRRCREAYADFGERFLRVFPNLMVCAGAKGHDACFGDSGGPLFGSADGRRRQIGVTSYGIGCAAAKFPGVYTEVNAPSIRGFIRSAASG